MIWFPCLVAMMVQGFRHRPIPRLVAGVAVVALGFAAKAMVHFIGLCGNRPAGQFWVGLAASAGLCVHHLVGPRRL